MVMPCTVTSRLRRFNSDILGAEGGMVVVKEVVSDAFSLSDGDVMVMSMISRAQEMDDDDEVDDDDNDDEVDDDDNDATTTPPPPPLILSSKRFRSSILGLLLQPNSSSRKGRPPPNMRTSMS